MIQSPETENIENMHSGGGGTCRHSDAQVRE